MNSVVESPFVNGACALTDWRRRRDVWQAALGFGERLDADTRVLLIAGVSVADRCIRALELERDPREKTMACQSM